MQQVQGALHVDLVGRLGDELRAGREDRRQVEDDGDLEFAHCAVEQMAVENVADHGRGAAPSQIGLERSDVERQDVEGPEIGEAMDQPVSYLAVRSGDEDRGLACHLSQSVVPGAAECARRGRAGAAC